VLSVGGGRQKIEVIWMFDGEVLKFTIRKTKKEVEVNVTLKEVGCENEWWMELDKDCV
jgi:hypothetical protein